MQSSETPLRVAVKGLRRRRVTIRRAASIGILCSLDDTDDHATELAIDLPFPFP